MNKKIIAFAGAAVLSLSMGTAVFAANWSKPAVRVITTASQSDRSMSYNSSTGQYGFMMDDKGNLLSKEDFTAKLDKEIKDGNLDKEDRDFYLRMYDNCAAGGNGAMSGGCCRGGQVY